MTARVTPYVSRWRRQDRARSSATPPDCHDEARLEVSLHALARRLERLSPCRHDPEAYFVEKDCIVRELRLLATRGRERACGLAKR